MSTYVIQETWGLDFPIIFPGVTTSQTKIKRGMPVHRPLLTSKVEDSVTNEKTTHGTRETDFTQSKDTVVIPKLVFIDAAVEDQKNIETWAEFLKQNGIEYTPSIDFSSDVRNFFKKLEENIHSCDRVIVLFENENVPERWLREHIRYYTSVQTRRDTPLLVKIYNPSRRIVNVQAHNLKITQCSTMQECINQ